MLKLWRQIYEVVGVRADDRFYFPFSFGPFLGFWAAFEGAARLGRFCLPGGGMTTNARLRMIIDHGITVICCTPTYALRLTEAALEDKLDVTSGKVRLLILAGEPGASIAATRHRLETIWGARVIDHYGMTEIGSLGIECLENSGGFHLLGDDCIPEVIDPATGREVAAGTEGELVLTNLGRVGSPLIRYRTGDRVIVDPDPCPCGRSWPRLKGGILGRTDDLMFIRGNNVYPAMLEAILRRFPEVSEFQIVVNGPELELRIETTATASPRLPERIEAAVRDAYHFRPWVAIVPPGSLPRAQMKSNRLVRKA
jgi:phenylacetate-CoA ligase